MSTPTVYDVAEQAGVSIATVSRVYRNPDSVRAPTRSRVLAAGRALGYVPSGSARGLASRSTGVLGLCFPDFHDVEVEHAAGTHADESMLYSDEVIRGMERAARRHGLALLIAATRSDRTDRQLADIAGRVDGLAVLASTVPHEELAHIRRRIPVVMLAGARNDAFDHVGVANFDGQLELTRHLITDHRLHSLVFVGGPPDSPDGEARFRGFQAAHLEAGLPLPDQPHVRGDLTQAAGRRAAQELLDRLGERPQGMVFANDQMATGALHALQSRGLDVPGDLVVTGFDGIPLSRLTRPALTTVRQPMGLLGEAAVELLVDRPADPERRPVARTLPVSVIRGESCGCSPRTAGS